MSYRNKDSVGGFLLKALGTGTGTRNKGRQGLHAKAFSDPALKVSIYRENTLAILLYSLLYFNILVQSRIDLEPDSPLLFLVWLLFSCELVV